MLATLRSIHGADVLHGDIRLANICLNASGEASFIDFSHALTEGFSQKDKDKEIQALVNTIQIDLPTAEPPAAINIEKPVQVLLRRSVRIKEIVERNTKVEPQNKQVKDGRPTRRRRK